MIRSIEDFNKNWAYEVESTLKVLNTLTDASLARSVTEDGRSLGFLGWHLAQVPAEMFGLAGLTIDAPGLDSPIPAVAAEIAEAYERTARSITEEVGKNWTDEMLEIEDDMFGERWARGLTLFYLITHQAHHRGQMTVLMRQAGLPVPGIYGPAKEEWQAMGMEPPA